MEKEFKPKIIARIRTDFPAKFGIPRQSGLVKGTRGIIVFEKVFRNAEALRGLEGFSHLWLIWQFSESVTENWSATVRPPRLGGNKRMGVFATRSPNRPNSIGLSCVRIKRIIHSEQGTVIQISGADMMDSTPVYDIKPYLPFTDCRENAKSGFCEHISEQMLKVEYEDDTLNKLEADKRAALIKLISQDPRPSYQNDSERVYGFEFAGFEVKFKVQEDTAQILSIEKI